MRRGLRASRSELVVLGLNQRCTERVIHLEAGIARRPGRAVHGRSCVLAVNPLSYAGRGGFCHDEVPLKIYLLEVGTFEDLLHITME